MSAASQLFSSGVAPIGTIAQGQFAGDSDWLLCDGSDYLSATYPSLNKTGLQTHGNYQPTLGTGYLSSATGAAITYGGGLFIAGYQANSIYITSPDGVTWTQRTWPGNQNNQYTNFLAYGAGVFVVVLSTNTSTSAVYTSTDGINWTSRGTVTAVSNNTICQVTFAGGLFFLHGQTTMGNGGVFYTSPDGITWTQRTWGYGNNLTCIAYGDGLFVGCDPTNGQWSSRDGINWSPIGTRLDTNATSGVYYLAYNYLNVYGIAYLNGIWYFGSNTGLWGSRDLRKIFPVGRTAGEFSSATLPFAANNMLYDVQCQVTPARMNVTYDGSGTGKRLLLPEYCNTNSSIRVLAASDGAYTTVFLSGQSNSGKAYYLWSDPLKFRTPVPSVFNTTSNDDVYLRSYIKAK